MQQTFLKNYFNFWSFVIQTILLPCLFLVKTTSLLCLLGFNKQTKLKTKDKTTLSNSKYESVESEVKPLHKDNSQDLSQPGLCEITSATKKRGDFVDLKRLNSSISSTEGVRSQNRNIHRKRKKKKRNKRYLTEGLDETEKNKNAENAAKASHILSSCDKNDHKSHVSKSDTKDNMLSPLSTSRKINFAESDASTKDSDYLTADLNDQRSGHQVTKVHSKLKDKDEQFLKERVAKAIKNLEAEKSDERRNLLLEGFKQEQKILNSSPTREFIKSKVRICIVSYIYKCACSNTTVLYFKINVS